LPGYGCADITSAIAYTRVKARLYDIDPETLSPDLDSLQRTLRCGVDAVLVAHYYGYPADMTGVRALTSRAGIPVLEDAAQAASGALEGEPLGSLGDVSILSFGRGKGLFGGRGGALLIRSHEHRDRISGPSSGTRRGIPEWCSAAIQWALGRPSLYALPASIPSLHLGEMVYRPAHEPRALSAVTATLVCCALSSHKDERAKRARTAKTLLSVAETARSLTPIREVPAAEPGYLRLAVRDVGRLRDAAPRLGIMRGYPRTLREQKELLPHLMPNEQTTPGAAELQRSLFTLPTHHRVSPGDLRRLEKWMAPSERKLEVFSQVATEHRPGQELFQDANR
jgi:dTDP-4-amino-4,6-dideoxygalactose transaminase